MAADLQTGSETKAPSGNYQLMDEQLENMRRDRRNIDKDLLYRSQFEPAWRHNIDKWNLVAPHGLQGTPNYVVPVSRMATHTGIVSMRQNLPDIVPVPEGRDEKKLSYLLKEASAHVHRMTNMEAVMDMGMVDYAVLGNTVLESYVKVPFKTKRIPILNEKGEKTGKFKKVQVRDWSKPKIGTRARSPWECAFDCNARTPAEVKRAFFQDRMSKAEFDEQYTNKPGNDYINLEHVHEGSVITFNKDGALDRISVDHDRIIIDYVQNELDDAYRIYANGVLIWDVPLSLIHAHGRCTVTLIPNHHKYDKNGKTHALYGSGDPELLADLDDLINASTNLFIHNYKLKNAYVVGVEGGNGLNVEDIDFESGRPVNGRITVQSLGAADLPEWQNFKTQLETWAVQTVKKNYMRLEGEVAKTAYEASQKKDAENVGMQYQIKKMEAGGLLEYARKHVSDIMEHLTVEEWADVVDQTPEQIEELITAKELTKDDVVYAADGKTPIKVRYVERIRTRGRVFEDKDSKNRSLDSLAELTEMEGQDGWLPMDKAYIHTRAWRLFKKIPDVYLVGKTILGQDDLTELSKIEQYVNIQSLITNLQAMEKQLQLKSGTNFDELRSVASDSIGIKHDQLSDSNDDEDIEKVDEAIDQAEQLLNPSLNGQVPTAVPGQAPGAIQPSTQQGAPPSPALPPVGPA